MNRTGLVIALAIGAVVGVVFAIWPQLDIAISRVFFDESYRVFPLQYSLVARNLRDLFTYLVAAMIAPAAIAIDAISRRRTLLFRYHILRRVHVPHRLGGARLYLPLAENAAER